MNKFFLVFLVFAILILTVFGFVKGEASLELKKGKNVLNLSEVLVDPFYVSDLIKLNPGIEAVSYVFDGDSFGYVNLFDGVGKNFIMIPGNYEVIAKEDLVLILPGMEN